MKELYLIRHSAPFVKIKDRGRIPFNEFSKNMILSAEGEKNASKLCNIQELSGVDAVLSLSFDFTSPHNLLISSNAASSVVIK